MRSRLSRRTFVKLGCGGLLGGALLCALGPAYALRVEPGWIEITRLDVPVSGLPEDLDGIAIAHLSDLHVGPHMDAQHVRRGVELTNALEPDAVILTGDFVFDSADYAAACATELASLRATQGVYAVLGNHDIWTDADRVTKRLENAGLVVLRNEGRSLTVGGARLWLLGIEDTGYRGFSFGEFKKRWREAQDTLAVLLDKVPAAEPRLLLVHNPDFSEMLPAGRIDLVLSGHTHGGQVRLPLVGAPVVPSCFGQKYTSGLVNGPDGVVYVNRGLGLIPPRVRFLCRPEITLLRLRTLPVSLTRVQSLASVSSLKTPSWSG